jgi:hypothetical protein
MFGPRPLNKAREPSFCTMCLRHWRMLIDFGADEMPQCEIAYTCNDQRLSCQTISHQSPQVFVYKRVFFLWGKTRGILDVLPNFVLSVSNFWRARQPYRRKFEIGCFKVVKSSTHNLYDVSTLTFLLRFCWCVQWKFSIASFLVETKTSQKLEAVCYHESQTALGSAIRCSFDQAVESKWIWT